MTFAEHFQKSRSHLAFIVGIVCAAGLAISVDNNYSLAKASTAQSIKVETSQPQMPIAEKTELSKADLQAAQVAWTYFEKNYNPNTGLVNSVDNFPSTTVWDQSSYLLGLISAYRLGIISEPIFDRRVSKLLNTLADLPLFFNKLPNKVYHTDTLEMTTYSNQPTQSGIGWSALDVARITVPLNILIYDYPKYSAQAGAVLQNWDFNAMVKDGVMLGARLHETTGLPETVQEGRLGYEEYAARALGLLGLDVMNAAQFTDYLKFEDIEGQEIATDTRTIDVFGAPNYVVSEPYILMAVEFGLDSTSKELSHRIYKAQEGRFLSTGQLTAVSEDNINQEPYFLYNSVYADGQAWAAVSEDGTNHPDLRTISTKAAFGWDAIYQTPYTASLVQEVLKTRTDDRGWVSGVYESDGSLNDISTANTNGIILEILNYKTNGPLVSARFSKEKVND